MPGILPPKPLLKRYPIAHWGMPLVGSTLSSGIALSRCGGITDQRLIERRIALKLRLPRAVLVDQRNVGVDVADDQVVQQCGRNRVGQASNQDLCPVR